MISVIIPVYNGEKYLQRCLDSIQHQTYTDFEAIIVDDGSTDGSGDICDNMAETDSRFQVIHQNNAGVSEARNAALAKAKGDVVFIDADDYVDSNYLRELIKGLDYPEVDIVFCAWQEEDEEQNIIAVKGVVKQDIIIASNEYVWDSELQHPIVWGTIFRKDIINGLEFDKRLYMGEDTLFVMQCLKKAKNLCFISSPSYHYVQHQESTCHGGFNLKKVTLIYSWEEICKLYHKSHAENMMTKYLALTAKEFCCKYYSDPGFLDSGCLDELIVIYRNAQYRYFKELIRTRKFKELFHGIAFGMWPRLFLEIGERTYSKQGSGK